MSGTTTKQMGEILSLSSYHNKVKTQWAISNVMLLPESLSEWHQDVHEHLCGLIAFCNSYVITSSVTAVAHMALGFVFEYKR